MGNESSFPRKNHHEECYYIKLLESNLHCSSIVLTICQTGKRLTKLNHYQMAQYNPSIQLGLLEGWGEGGRSHNENRSRKVNHSRRLHFTGTMNHSPKKRIFRGCIEQKCFCWKIIYCRTCHRAWIHGQLLAILNSMGEFRLIYTLFAFDLLCMFRNAYEYRLCACVSTCLYVFVCMCACMRLTWPVLPLYRPCMRYQVNIIFLHLKHPFCISYWMDGS